ncbi:family 1 extracellular solute-binding protein [Neobacillus bataviensis LMG 21833]|uniref:Family 1 extracellular solute-binding protein n=1 Tax=Neobacillus bataviensis LMG 21833 TaxID=1117379 RepID=K6C245_9BACI|nr:extracellular solute-binding protein [Neobacillus bataviensis]EKN65220.1 family 1 extracellular solute-binding protein [Neobacillus bataviensis LMG 21833]
MKEKNIKLVLIALILSVSGLAACSQTSTMSPKTEQSQTGSKQKEKINQTGFPIVNKKITLSMFAPNVGVSKWEDMKFFIEMEKKTNIHFTFSTPPLESFETRKKLLFASKELPDILYGSSLSNSEITAYSKQGFLIPLEELIEQYAPNIQEMFEEYPDVKKSITAADDHIYTLPSVDRSLPWGQSPLWYNGSFLNALHETDLPGTTEELYALLKRFKYEDPNGNGKQDEIPITAMRMTDIHQWFMGFFGIVSIKHGVYNGTVKYGAIQPEYKAYLEYMHQLWEEELLDHETFSQSNEQKIAKGNDNRIGLYAGWGPGAFLGKGDNDENPMVKPVTGPTTVKPVIPISTGQSVGQFAITHVNPNPEATIRWIDYSYSSEGSAFLHSLDVGDVWEWADKDKTTRKYITGLPTNHRGTLTPNYGIAVPQWTRIDFAKSFKNKFAEFNYRETDNKIIANGQVPFPDVFLKPEELDQVMEISTVLNDYVAQMEEKFITGEEPLSKWGQYIQTQKEIGVDRLVEVYQAAYDRFAETK